MADRVLKMKRVVNSDSFEPGFELTTSSNHKVLLPYDFTLREIAPFLPKEKDEDKLV